MLLHPLLDHLHQAALLRLQTREVGAQGRHIRLQGHAARFEQMQLGVHVLAHQGVGHAVHDVGMKLHAGRTRLLREQARLGGAHGQVVLAYRFIVGFGGGLLEHHQHLTFLHRGALAHQHLFDNAALQVLHRFALGVQTDQALGRDALIQGGSHCPQQQRHPQQGHGPSAHARWHSAAAAGRHSAGRGAGVLLVCVQFKPLGSCHCQGEPGATRRGCFSKVTPVACKVSV